MKTGVDDLFAHATRRNQYVNMILSYKIVYITFTSREVEESLYFKIEGNRGI